MSAPHEVSRRDFVTIVTGVLGAIMGLVVGLPAIGYLVDPATKIRPSSGKIKLQGKPEDFEVGKPTLRTFNISKVNGWEQSVNSYGVFVIKDDAGNFTVLSNVCTHLGCRVNWKEDIQRFACPCHEGFFELDGNNVPGGAPPPPLDRYEAAIAEDGSLEIDFKEG